MIRRIRWHWWQYWSVINRDGFQRSVLAATNWFGQRFFYEAVEFNVTPSLMWFVEVLQNLRHLSSMSSSLMWFAPSGCHSPLVLSWPTTMWDHSYNYVEPTMWNLIYYSYVGPELLRMQFDSMLTSCVTHPAVKFWPTTFNKQKSRRTWY